MPKPTLRSISVLLATIAMIAFNGLANGLPLNGQRTGQVSDRFDVYFVPAGYVFSIWGVIYLGLLAFALFPFLSSRHDTPRLRRLTMPYLVSAVVNMAWLLFWHYEVFAVTVLVMLVLLLSLITIYRRLGESIEPVPPLERWCVDIPFRIYLGWITVATIANITVFLCVLQWDGWGVRSELWTLVLLAAGTGIAAAVSLPRRDLAFLLVLVWAFVGIAIRHAEVPLVSKGAWVAAMVVGGMGVMVMMGKRMKDEG